MKTYFRREKVCITATTEFTSIGKVSQLEKSIVASVECVEYTSYDDAV